MDLKSFILWWRIAVKYRLGHFSKSGIWENSRYQARKQLTNGEFFVLPQKSPPITSFFIFSWAISKYWFLKITNFAKIMRQNFYSNISSSSLQPISIFFKPQVQSLGLKLTLIDCELTRFLGLKVIFPRSFSMNSTQRNSLENFFIFCDFIKLISVFLDFLKINFSKAFKSIFAIQYREFFARHV